MLGKPQNRLGDASDALGVESKITWHEHAPAESHHSRREGGLCTNRTASNLCLCFRFCWVQPGPWGRSSLDIVRFFKMLIRKIELKLPATGQAVRGRPS